MKVLVCGGRDYNNVQRVHDVLDELSPTMIITGGARGADYHAEAWARKNSIPFLRFPADWNTHGKAAGPIRNSQMLKESKPDLVVAFPGGRGTADMVRKATKANVQIKEVEDKEE
jgi:hypothetical protein